MPPRKKITEENVREALAKNIDLQDIAYQYGVKPYTVLLLVNKIEREEKGTDKENQPKYSREKKKITYLPAKDFDLEVGDIVQAVEFEISGKKHQYVVVGIYEHVYECERIPDNRLPDGNWRTTFRKQDYKRMHDPCYVKLVVKGERQIGNKKNKKNEA